MNINEQLEKILADLGVEMEYAEYEQHDENSLPEVSIFQSSRDHYGDLSVLTRSLWGLLSPGHH